MLKGFDQFNSQQLIYLILITIFLTSLFWFVFFPMIFTSDIKQQINDKHERRERQKSRERENKILKDLKRSM